MVILTKSLYVNGIQCLLLLWKKANDPSSLPPADEFRSFLAKKGYDFEELCKDYFKGYEDQKIVEVDGLQVRSDFFKDGELIEAKLSNVKDKHFDDLAFQKYVFELAGIKVNSCKVAHPNKDYVKNGEINVEEFVQVEDVTEKVEEKLKLVKDNIEKFKTILAGPEPDPLVRCKTDYEAAFNCPAHQVFKKSLPKFNVFDLVRTTKKDFFNPEKFYEQGFVKIIDIPDNAVLIEKQKIQRDCAINNNIRISKDELKVFFNSLKYPFYFLDFETISPTIPIYDGSSPSEKIPFQYSIYKVDENDNEENRVFLGDGPVDPRKEFIEKLIKDLEDDGSVIVYSSFEKSTINSLIEKFPEYKEKLSSIVKRLVDLAEPFKKFHYYNPVQQGKFSIKKVLPALTDLNYDNMNVSNGTEAIFSFAKLIEDPNQKNIRKDLIDYCNLDAKAMQEILNKLRELVG